MIVILSLSLISPLSSPFPFFLPSIHVSRADHQWGPTKESVKTGGANYIKQQLQPRSLPPGAGGGAPVDWSKGSYAGYFPNQPPMQQQPVMMQPGMMQPGMMQPGMGMGMMQPGMGMMPQQQFTVSYKSYYYRDTFSIERVHVLVRRSWGNHAWPTQPAIYVPIIYMYVIMEKYGQLLNVCILHVSVCDDPCQTIYSLLNRWKFQTLDLYWHAFLRATWEQGLRTNQPQYVLCVGGDWGGRVRNVCYVH